MMEWQYQIKFEILGFALLRRKDKFMSKLHKRWAIGKLNKNPTYWSVLKEIL